MKKFITVLLCVFTLFAFTACNKKVSTDKQFKDAYDKTIALDSYECKITTNVVTSIEGIETTTKTESNIKTSNVKSGKPVTLSQVKQQLPGVSTITTSMYTDDKYVYIDDGESKTKIALDDENLSDLIALLGGDNSDVSDTLIELPSDLLKDIELKKGDNDSSSFELLLTDEQFKNTFKDIIDAFNTEGEPVEGMEMTVTAKDAKINVTMDKKGYISVYELKFSLDMSMSYEDESMTTSMNISMKLEFVNPGDDVTVTPPADLDQYVDFEMPDFSDIPDLFD